MKDEVLRTFVDLAYDACVTLDKRSRKVRERNSHARPIQRNWYAGICASQELVIAHEIAHRWLESYYNQFELRWEVPDGKGGRSDFHLLAPDGKTPLGRVELKWWWKDHFGVLADFEKLRGHHDGCVLVVTTGTPRQWKMSGTTPKAKWDEKVKRYFHEHAPAAVRRIPIGVRTFQSYMNALDSRQQIAAVALLPAHP